MRSLPEKTLEHWTGLYIASRFPNADQWWPTLGEDVALTLRSSVISPGKLVMLEVKVPEATKNYHKLSISTAQLRRYLRYHLPVFYVLPVPRWRESLDPAFTPPRPAAGWWRSRSENWFADWTYVLSAAQVDALVPKTVKNPVLYTVPYSGSGAGSLPLALTKALPWQEFWREIYECGPAGAVRWRIVEDPRGRIIVTDLSNGEQVGFVTAREQVGFDVLQGQLPLQRGDNLVVVRIDEYDLRADSRFNLL
jgi:hypothetical protein